MWEDEEIRAATTPNEMRAEVTRNARANKIVYNVEMLASHSGMSGEDKYATMAYHLMRENAELRKHILNGLATQPTQIFITKDGSISTKKPSPG